MLLSEALERYTTKRPLYASLAAKVAEVLQSIAANSGIECRVSGREKDPQSYMAKVVTKGYADAWNDVTDKAGARVIVENAGDVDAMTQALRDDGRLRVVYEEDKRQISNPALLSYAGMHIQVALAMEEAPDEGELECEVQIRTAAQDIWSVLSHKLLYKPMVELPGELQHALYRLVALIELFDLEVERVMKALPQQPGYEHSELLRAAESDYLGLVHAQGRRDLSLHILHALGSIIPTTPEYVASLRAYVERNRDALGRIFDRYGPRSEMMDVPGYALFGQAESLALLERLEAMPLEVQSAWQAADLPTEWLETLASVVDAPIEFD